MAEKSLYDLCNMILGSEVEGIEVDPDEEVIYISTTRGTISIEGDDLHMYVETDRYDN